MTVAITAAHGVLIKLYTGGSFQTIDGVHNGPNGPGFQPNIISARHHGSEDTFNKVSTIEKTPVTFDIYYDSADSIHLALIAAAKDGTRSQFQETLTDTGAEVYTYYGYVSAAFQGQVDGFNIYSISITIDGSITVA